MRRVPSCLSRAPMPLLSSHPVLRDAQRQEEGPWLRAPAGGPRGMPRVASPRSPKPGEVGGAQGPLRSAPPLAESGSCKEQAGDEGSGVAERLSLLGPASVPRRGGLCQPTLWAPHTRPRRSSTCRRPGHRGLRGLKPLAPQQVRSGESRPPARAGALGREPPLPFHLPSHVVQKWPVGPCERAGGRGHGCPASSDRACRRAVWGAPGCSGSSVSRSHDGAFKGGVLYVGSFS